MLKQWIENEENKKEIKAVNTSGRRPFKEVSVAIPDDRNDGTID